MAKCYSICECDSHINFVENIFSNNKIKYYNQYKIYKVGEKVKSLRNTKFMKWVDSLFTAQVDLLPVNNGQNYELIEFKDGDFSDALSVSPNENTVWLTQEQIALLFDTTKQNISLHINNILSDGELDSNSVVKFFFTTASDGKRYNIMYYNLEMIISIGFRVTSKRGNLFRIWTNKVLKEYVLSGYAINEKRCLECHEAVLSLKNNFKELELKIARIEAFLGK